MSAGAADREPEDAPRKYQREAEEWVRKNPPPLPTSEQKALIANLLKKLRR